MAKSQKPERRQIKFLKEVRCYTVKDGSIVEDAEGRTIVADVMKYANNVVRAQCIKNRIPFYAFEDMQQEMAPTWIKILVGHYNVKCDHATYIHSAIRNNIGIILKSNPKKWAQGISPMCYADSDFVDDILNREEDISIDDTTLTYRAKKVNKSNGGTNNEKE